MLKRIELSIPAGTYIIGDPGYFIGHHWDTVGIFRGPAPGNPCIMMGKSADDIDWNERPLPSWDELNKLYPVVLLCTLYGDGGYEDNDGFTYSVDSGTLGMVPIELAQPGSETEGRVVTFDSEFDVIADYVGEVFHFGTVSIKLCP